MNKIAEICIIQLFCIFWGLQGAAGAHIESHDFSDEINLRKIGHGGGSEISTSMPQPSGESAHIDIPGLLKLLQSVKAALIEDVVISTFLLNIEQELTDRTQSDAVKIEKANDYLKTLKDLGVLEYTEGLYEGKNVPASVILYPLEQKVDEELKKKETLAYRKASLLEEWKPKVLLSVERALESKQFNPHELEMLKAFSDLYYLNEKLTESVKDLSNKYVASLFDLDTKIAAAIELMKRPHYTSPLRPDFNIMLASLYKHVLDKKSLVRIILKENGLL